MPTVKINKRPDSKSLREIDEIIEIDSYLGNSQVSVNFLKCLPLETNID